MKPMTPSGTRTREISIPFGRRQASTVSPTGSGSAATWRRPAAISSMRASESVSLSMKAEVSPAARPRVEVGAVGFEHGARLLLEPAGHLEQRFVLGSSGGKRERAGRLLRRPRLRSHVRRHVHGQHPPGPESTTRLSRWMTSASPLYPRAFSISTVFAPRIFLSSPAS